MNCKTINTIIIRTAVIIILLSMISGLCCRRIYADDGHISADSTTAEISVGDTFSIVLSTSEMSVSTFTGYVKYDESFVRYVSFSGNDAAAPKSVSLSDKEGNSVSMIVGANEDAPYFGFGLSGAADTAYTADDGFLTLTFQAVGIGIPVFIIGEDSDGKDGIYTEMEYVPDIIINNENGSEALKEVVDLIITEEPEKTAYSSGEYFDSSGMVVTAVYSDGTSEIITDYTVYDKTLSPDDTEIQIGYGGVKVKLPISVGDNGDDGAVSQTDMNLVEAADNSAEIESAAEQETAYEGKPSGNIVPVICIAAGLALIMIILFLVLFFGKKTGNRKKD